MNIDLTNLGNLVVDLKVLDERLQEWGLPSYAKEGDAGMDITACIDAPITILEGQNVLIPTGFAMHINNPNVFAALVPRSGLGHKKGQVLANLIGVIDSGYQNQVFASIWNRKFDEHEEVEVPVDPGSDQMQKELQHVDNSITINPGDKICQMIFLPVLRATFNVVTSFEASDRGLGGFGHTDAKD